MIWILYILTAPASHPVVVTMASEQHSIAAVACVSEAMRKPSRSMAR